MHNGIPLHSNGVCSKHAAPQNSWPSDHNLSSSIKLHHIERHTGREWRIHPHMHRNTPHAYFGPAQTPPWTPLHSKRAHNIRHLRERAHLLDERATSRSSKCNISSAAPVLSSVLMHTPVGTLRTRALAMPKACREPFAVICGCSQSHLSYSARNSCLSDPPLAHPNAPCQALYGPGLAAQVNEFLTRALGNPKRMPGSLCTQKMLVTRHRRQRA